MPTAHKLLIEFIYERKKGILRKRGTPYPIQGLHYEYGFKVTNIGESEFPGGEIKNVEVKFLSTETALKSTDVHFLPPLSPGKSVKRFTNNTIFDIPGPLWVSCSISPKEGQIEAFQCSKGQTNYVPLNPKNSWSNAEYVVPHMEYIQSNTNTYIILLTIITLVIGVASVFVG